VKVFDRTKSPRTRLILLDTLPSRLLDQADALIPGATFAEKAGSFENATNVTQAFEQAIPVREGARVEGQTALDIASALRNEERAIYDAPTIRAQMSESGVEALRVFASLPLAKSRTTKPADMQMVEL
jgi:anaerobic selenocysteine-containing dehydrogenase